MNSSPPDNLSRLYLTGYMGAGKSTIGKILARRLGYRLYDTDHLIMKGFRKPIARIFKENGEESFRKAELMVLNELTKREHAVIATGGGTLVREEAFDVARQSGTLIYLRAPINVLYERVIFSPKERPVIDVPDSESVFREKFEQRQSYYERADVTVDTHDRKPEDVVRDILHALDLKGKPHARASR